MLLLGEEDCSCVITLGTNSTLLNPKKEGLCKYTLQSSPGSQVSFTTFKAPSNSLFWYHFLS